MYGIAGIAPEEREVVLVLSARMLRDYRHDPQGEGVVVKFDAEAVLLISVKGARGA